MSASTLQAEFDGRVFVPRQQVNLPVGTTVEVLLPPADPSPDDDREWCDLLKEIHASEPAYPTVDEAMRQSRMRP
jgi:hypothetical protein